VGAPRALARRAPVQHRGCALQLCDIKETVGAKVPQELAEH